MRGTFSFEGRVAVVTGAGRGLGRAYAELLAARGASVVVNDIDAEPASAVVRDINAAGGSAVADVGDVSTVERGAAVVAAAIDAFQRVDIVVNNAGINRFAEMPDVDAASLDEHLAVHVAATFYTVRAAWAHFVTQGYGRVVNTTSTGVLGLANNLPYATAKGGVIGMTRSLAVAGRKQGIKVNCIAPAAYTRLAGDGEGPPEMTPERAAPLVAYLAHEDCPVTGEVYTAGAGRFARLFIGSTEGVVLSDASIEDVAEHWEAINDESRYFVPRNLSEWSAAFLKHL